MQCQIVMKSLKSSAALGRAADPSPHPRSIALIDNLMQKRNMSRKGTKHHLFPISSASFLWFRLYHQFSPPPESWGIRHSLFLHLQGPKLARFKCFVFNFELILGFVIILKNVNARKEERESDNRMSMGKN